eukprot:4926391-Amphidinium_carterae.2
MQRDRCLIHALDVQGVVASVMEGCPALSVPIGLDGLSQLALDLDRHPTLRLTALGLGEAAKERGLCRTRSRSWIKQEVSRSEPWLQTVARPSRVCERPRGHSDLRWAQAAQ